jgi:hypothetical protein
MPGSKLIIGHLFAPTSPELRVAASSTHGAIAYHRASPARPVSATPHLSRCACRLTPSDTRARAPRLTRNTMPMLSPIERLPAGDRAKAPPMHFRTPSDHQCPFHPPEFTSITPHDSRRSLPLETTFTHWLTGTPPQHAASKPIDNPPKPIEQAPDAQFPPGHTPRRTFRRLPRSPRRASLDPTATSFPRPRPPFHPFGFMTRARQIDDRTTLTGDKKPLTPTPLELGPSQPNAPAHPPPTPPPFSRPGPQSSWQPSHPSPVANASDTPLALFESTSETHRLALPLRSIHHAP